MAKIKILIVEDEKPMAKVMELKLKKEGFDAHAVFNGEEAVAAIEKNDYALVILDLIMPKLDGWGVLKILKEKGIKIPVIVASNLSQKDEEKLAKELGAAKYYVKSETPIVELVKNIKEVLGIEK